MPQSNAVESLEPRRHFSVTLKDGVLTIIGTRRHDTIEVYVSGRQHIAS